MNDYDLSKFEGDIRFNFSNVERIKKEHPEYPIKQRKLNNYLNSINVSGMELKKEIIDRFVTCNQEGSFIYQALEKLYKDMQSVVSPLSTISDNITKDSINTYNEISTKFYQLKAIYDKYFIDFKQKFYDSVDYLKRLKSNTISVNLSDNFSIFDIKKLEELFDGKLLKTIQDKITNIKHDNHNKKDDLFNVRLKRLRNIPLLKNVKNFPDDVYALRDKINALPLSEDMSYFTIKLFIDNINNIFDLFNDFKAFLNTDMIIENYSDIQLFISKIPTFFYTLETYFRNLIYANNHTIDVDLSSVYEYLDTHKFDKIYSNKTMSTVWAYEDWISDPTVISEAAKYISGDEDDDDPTMYEPDDGVTGGGYGVNLAKTNLNNQAPVTNTIGAKAMGQNAAAADHAAKTQMAADAGSKIKVNGVDVSTANLDAKARAKVEADVTNKEIEEKAESDAEDRSNYVQMGSQEHSLYKRSPAYYALNPDSVDYANAESVYDPKGEFSKDTVQNSLLTSAFVGIGMPPLFHSKDDPGHSHFFRKMGARYANIFQMRVVILDEKKRKAAMTFLKDYVAGKQTGDNNPYQQKIKFNDGIFSKANRISKLDEIRTAGINDELGREAFLDRLTVIVAYTSKAMGQNEILYGLSNQFTSVMTARGKIVQSVGDSLEEFYNNVINNNGKVGASARIYKSKMLAMVIDYIKRMMDNHNYLTFFSATDIAVSDNFSNSTKPFPETYAQMVAGSLYNSATGLMGNMASSIMGRFGLSGTKGAAASAGLNAAAQVAQDAAKKKVYGLSAGTSSDDLAGTYGSFVGGHHSVAGISMPDRFNTDMQHSLGVNQLAFELYQASQHSKSMSVSMKFISPYADSRQVYLYTMLPYFIILIMVLPQQLDQLNSGNIFYVQTDIPGIISSDLAIVQSVSKTVLQEYGFNSAGMPLGIQVDISIQDLYNGFGVPNQTGGLMMSPNFLSYLNTLMGFSREMEIDDFSTYLSRLKSTLYELWTKWKIYAKEKVLGVERAATHKFTRVLDISTRSRLYNRSYDIRNDLSSIKALRVRLLNSMNDYSMTSLGFTLYTDMDGTMDAATMQEQGTGNKVAGGVTTAANGATRAKGNDAKYVAGKNGLTQHQQDVNKEIDRNRAEATEKQKEKDDYIYNSNPDMMI